MLKNYLVTAFRILWRQKGYSAINIFGLTLGIACSLLIIIYIADELSYDKFHTDRDRIYRAGFMAKIQGRDITSAQTGIPMAYALQNEFPEVESTLRIANRNSYPIRFEEKSFNEDKVLMVDSNFFQFFNFKLLVGNPVDVLRGPNKIVITESTAKKYFGYTGTGDLRPIGKTMIIGGDGKAAEITGIVKDTPSNSHFHFNFLVSLETWNGLKYGQWLSSEVTTYFKIRSGTNIQSVDNRYQHLVEKYGGPEVEKYLNMSLQHFIDQGGKLGFFSTPMLDIHLTSNHEGELEPNGSEQYLYLFGAIAFFIIILACINFMNLSTARSANRAKEVGVRKTIGAMRGRLLGQFLMESYMYTAIAVVLAVGVVFVSMTYFNLLTGKILTATALAHPVAIAGLIGFTLLVGLMAGSYPAFYLTSFKPIDVLKGKVRAGMKSSGIRNFLVVFQFLISITLIISTLMVYKQLKFVQSKSLGFNKENVINLLHTKSLGKNTEAFRNELLKYPEVIAASYANKLPPDIDWSTIFRPSGTEQDHLMNIYAMDYDHLAAMNFQMVKGRFFSRDFPTDTAAIILNETAARQMGLQDFEGKSLYTHFESEKGKDLHIIGIIKDFNFRSLHDVIGPMVVVLGPDLYYEMAIRLTPGNELEKVKTIERAWKKFSANNAFEYSFLDENFNAKFRTEQQLGQLFLVFTSLAILIACLGLLGLATFTAEQRAKEISIRKVMGASVSQMAVLVAKDFAKLVVIAFVIAVPVTWYCVENMFLSQFAYRIDFDILVVILSGLAAFLIAVVTISSQAIKAAMGNPVKSLRSE